jgi:3'-phosphoadenosine 5'-phosphosulfate sulfotransferase (PAPS reductase)/FAD synthetase
MPQGLVGAAYPWKAVGQHSRSTEFARAVLRARRVLDDARETGAEFRLTLSCGKDSTALAGLCVEDGWRPQVVSVKDDLDYPGELAYLHALCSRLGLQATVLQPDLSLQEFLRFNEVSLLHDLHGRAARLSAEFFYGLLDHDREVQGYDGLLLGLRSEESRARRANRASHGTMYRRKDGVTVACPLSDWSALDVHAFLASRDLPLLPVYLCFDAADEPFVIRKSWWVCGGGPAAHGHYSWLRRWWPEQWAAACRIDPAISALT